MNRAVLEPCDGCGALFPPSDGPTHRYIGASAGCWALFAPLSAGETPGPDLLASSRVPSSSMRASPLDPPDAALGTLIADAYAAQHHGTPSPQAIQSVAGHLLTLYGVCRRGVPVERASWPRSRALRKRRVFQWLDPPPPLGTALTVRHLFPGGGVTTPCSRAAYVASVLDAWEQVHGATIAEWYERFVLAD